MKINNSHRKALEKISSNPEIIGISRKEVLIVSIEQKLFYRGGFYIQPDIVFELKNGKFMIIEYKSIQKPSLVQKGRKQLKKAIDFYQEIKKTNVEGKLITGESIFELRKRHNYHNKDGWYNSYHNKLHIMKNRFNHL